MDDTFFDIPLEINSDFDKRVSEVFQIYDYESNNMTNAESIGAILRTLGCVPTEEEIQEIVEQTEFEQRKGTVHLARLIAYIKPLLLRNQMKPHTTSDLLKVFKILDPKNRGYIPKAEFVKVMREVGEAITENELKEMLKIAVDPITMRINYEEYINKISYEPNDEDSIFGLAVLSEKNE